MKPSTPKTELLPSTQLRKAVFGGSLKIIQIISLSIPLLLPVSGSGAELGTRQQTIRPLALLTNTLAIPPNDVPDYGIYGYSEWQLGPGENEGQRLDLMTNGYAGAT